MPRPILMILPLAAALSGCVAAQTSLTYGTFAVTERPPTFCEHYAEQTYLNTVEDLTERGEGFGARGFARERARATADRAYDRCLAGRTN
ncbi:hypothetical protein [Aureimonas populi]|uniref:Lipoprotein n=1 Tax=Aureimonas populi TaxID=1701758 RepID=A0ABW5CFE7_9HYPH|nr:hypothetical protein [Aureimonas populi]